MSLQSMSRTASILQRSPSTRCMVQMRLLVVCGHSQYRRHGPGSGYCSHWRQSPQPFFCPRLIRCYIDSGLCFAPRLEGSTSIGMAFVGVGVVYQSATWSVRGLIHLDLTVPVYFSAPRYRYTPSPQGYSKWNRSQKTDRESVSNQLAAGFSWLHCMAILSPAAFEPQQVQIDRSLPADHPLSSLR